MNIKNSKKKHPQNFAAKNNASPPQGKPIYCANVSIDKTTIRIEILNPENPVLDFKNTCEDAQVILSLFTAENVRGVNLSGKKADCDLFAQILLKQGIRPLIAASKEVFYKGLRGLPTINEHVAGIDIGKSVIYVSIPRDFDEYPTRAFGTFTDELESLVSWLKERNIKEVAMESTSVFWIPLYDLCEINGIKALIVNPKNVKMLPGRKTDVLDSQWLMRLLSCGLLQGGFIPPKDMRSLRDLARHRQDLMERSADCLNMIHKALAQMNLHLSNVVSDVSGKSGMAIIKAIIEGERNPNVLATLADKRCKSSEEEFARALKGSYNEECLFMMKIELEIYEKINATIIQEELKIKELLERLPDKLNPSLPVGTKRRRKKAEYNRSPYCFDLRTLLRQKFSFDLTCLSGIDESIAATIIFETGGSMDAFPTYKHFASWNATSPGNKKSGGKVLSGRAPKKFSRVGQALRMAANANYHADSADGGYLRRLQHRGKSKKTARKATAHRLGTKVYNIMKFGQAYVEKGAAEYEKAFEERKVKAMTKTLRELGYEVIKKVA